MRCGWLFIVGRCSLLFIDSCCLVAFVWCMLFVVVRCLLFVVCHVLLFADWCSVFVLCVLLCVGCLLVSVCFLVVGD